MNDLRLNHAAFGPDPFGFTDQNWHRFDVHPAKNVRYRHTVPEKRWKTRTTFGTIKTLA
jgi:hypothetical protein